MTNRLIALSLTMLFISACGKDAFQSKPILQLKSVSSTFVPIGYDLQIIMRLTDMEGDIVDTIWVMKTTTSCESSDFIDSTLYRIPAETPRTRNFDGEVIVSFSYPVELQPRCNDSDTATFRFWVKDEKNNKSDTISTPPIIIER